MKFWDLLLTIALRFTYDEKKNLVKHQKDSEYYEEDCRYFADQTGPQRGPRENEI